MLSLSYKMLFSAIIIALSYSLVSAREGIWGTKFCGDNMVSNPSSSAKIDTTSSTSRQARVIGGKAATIDEFPWQVSLQKLSLGTFLPLPEWAHICGASIIAPNWILTAAHCVDSITLALIPAQLRVVIGTSYWKNALFQRNAQIVSIAEIIVHEKWDSNNGYNDIALLRTNKPIEFRFGGANNLPVNAICLSTNQTDWDGYGLLSGWGRQSTGFIADINNRLPNQLQKIVVPIVDKQKCKEIYEKEDVYLTDEMLCAGMYDNGNCLGAYAGDSGGALIKYVGGKSVQIGIVSFSLPCRTHRAPDVYTKISKYIDWISSKIKDPYKDGELMATKEDASLNETLAEN